MLNSEKKRYFISKLEEQSQGQACVSTAEVARILGCGRTKAREYTYGLPSYGGRYLIPEVAERLVDLCRFS